MTSSKASYSEHGSKYKHDILATSQRYALALLTSRYLFRVRHTLRVCVLKNTKPRKHSFSFTLFACVRRWDRPAIIPFPRPPFFLTTFTLPSYINVSVQQLRIHSVYRKVRTRAKLATRSYRSYDCAARRQPSISQDRRQRGNSPHGREYETGGRVATGNASVGPRDSCDDTYPPFP